MDPFDRLRAICEAIAAGPDIDPAAATLSQSPPVQRYVILVVLYAVLVALKVWVTLGHVVAWCRRDPRG
jgi:hypothetical protein